MSGGRRNLPPVEREMIVREYVDGLKVQAIAVNHEISETTVNNLRKAAGIPARTQWTRRRPLIGPVPADAVEAAA